LRLKRNAARSWPRLASPNAFGPSRKTCEIVRVTCSSTFMPITFTVPEHPLEAGAGVPQAVPVNDLDYLRGVSTTERTSPSPL